MNIRQIQHVHELERIDKVLPHIPIKPKAHSETRTYAQRVVGSGVREVVALHELDEPTRQELARHKIRVHDLHLPPSRSFSQEGKDTLARAAILLRDNLKAERPTAVTCTYGNHRTGRAYYLLYRLLRAGHEHAMTYSDAPLSSEQDLRDFYEKEMRPNLRRYRKAAGRR